ncbi:SDR family NAD(P)-dependent oxidoreductase [Asaia astilbis]
MTALPERFSLVGKCAVVTGASRGLGVTLCEVLSQAGADIVAVARDESLLTETQAIVTKNGRRCLPIAADLLDAAAADRVKERIQSEVGSPTILVNNAGMTIPKLLVDQTVEEWDAILNLNLRAPWLMARALAPGMMAAGGGKIINISSMTSSVALTEHGAYLASKAGLNGLTKVMTAEWGPIIFRPMPSAPRLSGLRWANASGARETSSSALSKKSLPGASRRPKRLSIWCFISLLLPPAWSMDRRSSSMVVTRLSKRRSRGF